MAPEERHSLAALAPATWFGDAAKGSIWLRGYRVMRVSNEQVPAGPKITDLGDVRAVLLFGTIQYQDSRSARIEVISETEWHYEAPEIRDAPRGCYLLLLTPYFVNGAGGDEPAVRARLDSAAGLFAALSGPNLVYRHLFDNEVAVDEERVSGVSEAIRNPLSMPAPHVTDSDLATIAQAETRIAELDEATQNRTRLSLRWFLAAIDEQSGVDAFLRYWIALETLSMPDTTNIRPLEEAVCRSYGVPYEEGRRRFAIGKVFGLRAAIVHDGRMVGLHASFLDYVQALYVDVFTETLGLSSRSRAARVLDEVDVDAYLASLLRTG